MKTLDPIALRHLNNANFYQFVKNTVDIADQAEPELGLEVVAEPLHEDLLMMADGFKKKNLSEETKQIVNLDRLRDRAFKSLKTRTESYLTDDLLPGAAVHAEHTMVILKRYGSGKIPHFDFNKETAVISNLVVDLQKEAAPALQALNLTQAVVYLAQCNTNFESKYAVRGDAATQLANVMPMHKLRPAVYDNYATFVRLVESLQFFNAAHAAAIGEIIDRMNQEIKIFNTLINIPEVNPADTAA
jgi:Family of unknown function (DUF6261)